MAVGPPLRVVPVAEPGGQRVLGPGKSIVLENQPQGFFLLRARRSGAMGVMESKCPTCGAKIVVVFHDRSLETLMVERVCDCEPVPTVPARTD